VAVPRDPADAPGWVRERLGYSFHLCSTAPVGASPDAGAVVGPDLAVHGVEGLRLADAAVLPSAPSRGPAATAALVGELAAELLLTDRRG
jgi:choline dehydrogenase-like flavoprotein